MECIELIGGPIDGRIYQVSEAPDQLKFAHPIFPTSYAIAQDCNSLPTTRVGEVTYCRSRRITKRGALAYRFQPIKVES